MGAVCPYCGSGIGVGDHDELCKAWKHRKSNVVGWIIAWLSGITIICALILMTIQGKL